MGVSEEKCRGKESPLLTCCPCCFGCGPGCGLLSGLQVHIFESCWASHPLTISCSQLELSLLSTYNWNYPFKETLTPPNPTMKLALPCSWWYPPPSSPEHLTLQILAHLLEYHAPTPPQCGGFQQFSVPSGVRHWGCCTPICWMDRRIIKLGLDKIIFF